MKTSFMYEQYVAILGVQFKTIHKHTQCNMSATYLCCTKTHNIASRLHICCSQRHTTSHVVVTSVILLLCFVDEGPYPPVLCERLG